LGYASADRRSNGKGGCAQPPPPRLSQAPARTAREVGAPRERALLTLARSCWKDWPSSASATGNFCTTDWRDRVERHAGDGARARRAGITGWVFGCATYVDALEELGAAAFDGGAEGDAVRGPEGRPRCSGRVGKMRTRSLPWGAYNLLRAAKETARSRCHRSEKRTTAQPGVPLPRSPMWRTDWTGTPRNPIKPRTTSQSAPQGTPPTQARSSRGWSPQDIPAN